MISIYYLPVYKVFQYIVLRPENNLASKEIWWKATFTGVNRGRGEKVEIKSVRWKKSKKCYNSWTVMSTCTDIGQIVKPSLNTRKCLFDLTEQNTKYRC